MGVCTLYNGDYIVDLVRMLFSKGIYINHTDRDGSDALMALYAFSKSEQIEMVAKLLIASGIDTDRTNHWKMKTS